MLYPLPNYLQEAANFARLEKARQLTISAVKWQPVPNSPQEMAYYSKADELFFGGAAGGGKALSIHGIIPTSEGYKRVLDLRNGDKVFGVDGQLYSIVGMSDVMLNHRVFDVVFDDDTIIRADGEHRWLTFTYNERMAIGKRSDEARAKRRANRPSRSTGKRPELALRNSLKAQDYKPQPVTGGERTTLEIKSTLLFDGRHNHAIPMPSPLQLPPKELPIPPYVLGFWLGDGNSYAGRVTVGDEYIQEVVSIFESEGYTLRRIPSDKYGYGVLGLQKQLRESGFLKNKHIPDDYIFASYEQRLALLQGLMDTDGYASTSGQCEFYSSKHDLITAFSRLLHTFGIKHAIREKKAPKGTDYNVSYRVKFVAPFHVFRLPQKANRQNTDLRETQKWRYIVDVREVESEPVKCIAINSPDHLYLAGTECVPTHNSDLVLGLAANLHWRSIIFRRVFPSIRALIERSREIFNPLETAHAKDSYNESLHIWRLQSGQMIEFGSIQHEKDVQNYKGRPHDLYAFDELPEFTEYQYRFVTAWNRTTKPNQRTRIVSTGNPPSTAEGEWVVRYWGAWLDPQHTNPAKAGELRWFVTIDGKDTELENGQPFDWKGETLYPKSRTFIPARLTDNPYLRDTGYMATLNGLPEPLRSQLLYGDFGLTTQDDAWQVLPTSWVRMAQDRWASQTRPDWQHQTALGVDVAHGGQDKTTIASLYGVWFDELVSVDGRQTPLGKDVVLLVRDAHFNPRAVIGIDAVGYGASAAELLEDHRYEVVKINAGSSPTDPYDKTEKFGFANLRAQMYWRFREALDPESGQAIALPPDRELLVDLCAARYTLRSGKYWIEPKDDLKARIGRSPDKGEAVLHAWHAAYGEQNKNVIYNPKRGNDYDWRRH